MAIVASLLLTSAAAQIGMYDQQRTAARKMRRAEDYEQLAEINRQRRDRLDRVKRAQRARAQVLNTAIQSGQGGSAVAGAEGSILTQTASDVGFLTGQSLLGQLSGKDKRSAANNLSNANTYSAVSNLALTGATLASGGPKTTDARPATGNDVMSVGKDVAYLLP